MSDREITLDELIEYFIRDSQEDESIDNGNGAASLASKNNIIKAYAMDKIRDGIVNEIKSEVRQSIIEEYENENEKNSMQYAIKLIIETFVIACLVGLIVNQFTDLINISKGQSTHVFFTLCWIGLFVIVLAIIFSIDVLNKIIKFIK